MAPFGKPFQWRHMYEESLNLTLVEPRESHLLLLLILLIRPIMFTTASKHTFARGFVPVSEREEREEQDQFVWVSAHSGWWKSVPISGGLTAVASWFPGMCPPNARLFASYVNSAESWCLFIFCGLYEFSESVRITACLLPWLRMYGDKSVIGLMYRLGGCIRWIWRKWSSLPFV